MKSILMSIQPKWVAKILNGEKTIEVRKRFPKDYRGWVYIYCTKGDKNNCLEYADNPDKTKEGKWCLTSGYPYANGKVVARFYCDNVEEIDVTLGNPEIYIGACIGDLWCLENGYHDKNYCCKAIHISQLEIFDKPKEIWEFMLYTPIWKKSPTGKYYKHFQLTKAPQSYMYIEVEL